MSESRAEGARDGDADCVCRICGCTGQDACADLFGEPCHRIEPDLCSACAYEPAVEPASPRAAFAGAGAVGFTRGAS